MVTIYGPDGQPLTTGKPETAGYRAAPPYTWGWNYGERPRFSYHTIEMMRFDPMISFGMRMRKAPLMSATKLLSEPTARPRRYQGFAVEAQDELKEFVEDQIAFTWLRGAPRFLRFQDYGFAGFEVVHRLKNGRVIISGVCDFHPHDVRPLTKDGQLVGLRVQNVEQKGKVELWGMKGLWLIHERQYGQWFGSSQYERAYAPWHEKWSEGGAIDVRKLKMHKDSYGGDVLKYPNKEYPMPDGEKIHARTIAQRIVEQRKAGGVITMPSTYDKDSNPEWVYERPETFGSAQEILDYPKELDTEMLRGLDIPDDLIQSTVQGGTGTYGGRKITQEAFYSIIQQEWQDFLAAFDEQVLNPLVALNFGPRAEYRLMPLSLEPKPEDVAPTRVVVNRTQGEPGEPAAAPAEDNSLDSLMRGPANGREGVQLSQAAQALADTLVGLGVWGAGELVSTVDAQLAKRSAQLSLDDGPMATSELARVADDMAKTVISQLPASGQQGPVYVDGAVAGMLTGAEEWNNFTILLGRRKLPFDSQLARLIRTGASTNVQLLHQELAQLDLGDDAVRTTQARLLSMIAGSPEARTLIVDHAAFTAPLAA